MFKPTANYSHRYFVCFFLFYSLYTTVVQATDSQALFAIHTLQSCGNAYRLTSCKIVCITSLVKHTRWRVPMKPARRLSLPYMSLLLITVSTEIELNSGPTSFPCGSCGLEVLDMLLYLVITVNIGFISNARIFHLPLLTNTRQLMCLSLGYA